MRFAYIDSNGNEVPIPSVDALALRIELGAITDDTQLFDAQSGEWAPATNHEIYHTLRRSSGADDGFIAPPPVTPPPVAAAPPVEDEAAAAPVSDLAPDPEPEPEEAEPEPAEPEAAEPEPAEPEPEAPAEGEDEDLSFGLTLAEAPEVEEAEEGLTLDAGFAEDSGASTADGGPPTDEESDEAEPESLDLAPPPEPLDEGDAEPMDLSPPAGSVDEAPAVASEDLTDPGSGTFDFGGMEGGLELEAEFESPGDDAPMDFAPPADGSALDFGAGEDESVGGFGGDMELETPMEFGSGGFEMDSGDALDLETPMSEFSPDAPPSWMEEGAEADDGEVLDFTSVGDESSDDVPLRDRRTPKNRPSRPRRPRRSMTGPFIAVVFVVAIGVGAYAAWPLISATLSASGEDDVQEVFLPPLSEELVPQMREAVDAALATTFEAARVSWAAEGGIAAPPSDWLAGVYLAQASDYQEAQAFWEGMDRYLASLRSIDLAAFDAAFAAEMTSRGVAADDAAAMRARADSGFVAAAEEREESFLQLESLVDASLRLHQFLVTNEANIEYAPASTVTTDPILEVNPASEEIADAMGELIDAVTRGLGGLGYRDQVTAAGLRQVVLARVQANGVR